MASWHRTLNKNKSTFSVEKIPAITRSMVAQFDQINEKINKNYEELHVKIKQTNDDLTSKWTQFTSRIENSFLTLQEDQNKNQAVLTAILDILQILNDLQPNSPRTPEQPDPLFNMSSSNAYTQGCQIQVKFKLPKYDGDERQCIAWINKDEEYLDIHNIHYDDEKIKYASMHLEESAYNWYLW